MSIVETSIGRIGVEQRGSGGVPLLFLHGVGSDRSAWLPQLERFGPERLTIAMDYPGYGESKALADPSLPTFAKAAVALLDALELERAHVCGLSLGGVVAIGIAEAAPERVASLVLADTFAWHPDGSAILERSLAGLARLGMRGLAETRVDALLAAPANPALRAELVETMARIDPDAYAQAARIVWLADQRSAAAAIRCPTLILCGSEDRVTPPSLSEALKALMPGAGMVEIAGAGHLPNLEQPAIFNRVLAGFLSDIDD